MPLQILLPDITEANTSCFADNLVGVYVHGSVAFGCFSWAVGDVDYLTVVNHAPSLDEKIAYANKLLEISAYAPRKGIETSVVTLAACESFEYPTPYEFHFSKLHIDECRKDVSAYCERMHGVDYDLAAHFAVAKLYGITLFGKKAGEVFHDVPKEAFLDSICRDGREACESVVTDPVYSVLNLCRVMAYIKEELVLSKLQGGEWGKACLSEKYEPLIQSALSGYIENKPPIFDVELADEFASEMLREIDAAAD